MKPTNNSIKQAAKLAGVSVASVSRALNGKPGISEKTRQRIIDVCNELGYQPSDAARKLKIGTQANIGLCIGNKDKQYSHYTTHLFEQLNKLMVKNNLILTIYTADKIDNLIKDCSAAIITGIEKEDSRLSRLQESNLPYVVIGEAPNSFWVSPDDNGGGVLAAQHLLSANCKNIVIIEQTQEGAGAKDRTIGFQNHMQDNGYIPAHFYINEQNAIELQTYRAIAKLFANGAFKFDGAFCENDDIAYGLLLACEDNGLKVPEDVKIVGFDYLPNVFEEITTIKQDISVIAQKCFDLLQDAQTKKLPRHIQVPVELIQGKTT